MSRLRILTPPGVVAYLDACEPAVPWLSRPRVRGLWAAWKMLPLLASSAPLAWPCPEMARGLEGSHERYAARWFAEKVADSGRCPILLAVEVLSTVAAGVAIEGVDARICGGGR